LSGPGLGGVHHTGVAGPTGSGGSRRWTRSAGAATHRDVLPAGRLVSGAPEPVTPARA